jgi:hypothetical protein
MNRKVFIITGYANEENEEENIKTIACNYAIFFQTNAGGAYESNEVVVINEPIVNDLERLYGELILDFCICVYIGHGATLDDNQLIQLNRDEIIRVGQLALVSKKQLIILESCRSLIDRVSIMDFTERLPKFRLGGTFKLPIKRSEARIIYDFAITKSHEGLSICYACSKGQYAIDFIFSTKFLEFSFNWHSNRENTGEILLVKELMSFISDPVFQVVNKSTEYEQDVDFEGDANFPIAVNKY